MKGKVFKKLDGLSVRYKDVVSISPLISEEKEMPLYFDDYYPPSIIGKDVEFIIVDEFTHSHLFKAIGWGDGIKYAKIVKEYSEEDVQS
jgi:hypothetical protein